MRLFKHLFAPPARRMFRGENLQHIAAAIAASEARHTGEIRFAVESSLSLRALPAGMQARDRARELFAQLGVWDTRENNGVLLYLLLAEHRIELVADRGFDGLVGAAEWREVARRIEERLREGAYEAGVLAGIEALSALIERHFPRTADHVELNELPDEPHLL